MFTWTSRDSKAPNIGKTSTIEENRDAKARIEANFKEQFFMLCPF